MMLEFDIAIVGAGASGVLTAVHLQRSAPSLKVALLDAGARAARGLAYGTPYGAHLLNVPAGRMSAFTNDPDHFTRWLSGRMPDSSAKTFAPRKLYGEYLAEVLGEVTVARISGNVVGLTRNGQWTVHLHDGRTINANNVVLALGNLAPADPLHFGEQMPNGYLRDPWAPGAAQGLPHGASILIIGTGLTMIDLVLALRAEGHRGRVVAFSRRGLVPRPHLAHLSRPIELPADTHSPRALLRWLRREVGVAAEQGHDWRSVIDALRPHTQSIWRSWSLASRRSFLRHARAWWDVHRHRCAPEVAAQMEALLADGTLTVRRGQVRSIRDVADGAEVELRTPAGTEILRVARVINCTGPASDYAAVDLPLVVQLRRAGWLVPDALKLGVETDIDGRMIGADGMAIPTLFTIGPLRRAALWESTAIPDIREQALALAELLAADGSRRHVHQRM